MRAVTKTGNAKTAQIVQERRRPPFEGSEASLEGTHIYLPLQQTPELPHLLLQLAAPPLEPEEIHEEPHPHCGVRREQVRQVGHAASPPCASASRRSAATSSASRALRMRSAINHAASSTSASADTTSPARIHGSTSPEPPSFRVITAGWMPRSRRTDTMMSGMSSTPTMPSTAA